MVLKVSEKQLSSLDDKKRLAVLIKHRRTNRAYAIIAKQTFDDARPLMRLTQGASTPPFANGAEAWTEEQNARRVALVNKQYESRLTTAEQRELVHLQEKVRQHQEHVAPQNNHALELILEALEHRAKKSSRRRR